MYFFPFIKRKFKSNLSPEKIQEVLRKTTSVPDKKIDANKLSNLRIFESKIFEKEFVVVMGRYAFTYGKAGLSPVMKGKISSSSTGYTDISISIHTFETASIIYLVFCLLAVAALTISIQKEDIEGIIVTSLFLLITYWIIIAKFNKEVKTYLNFLETEFKAY
jgi:hypothetical protein